MLGGLRDLIVGAGYLIWAWQEANRIPAQHTSHQNERRNGPRK
jgi:hypothetical protein